MAQKIFDGTHGLLVYRASRLEALVPPLVELVKAVPASEKHLLVKQTVLVAHAGMRRWLTDEVAKLRHKDEGSKSIVADLDLVLFSTWMDRLAQKVEGSHAVAVEEYRHGTLRWTVFDVLGAIETPLKDIEDDQRRMQVADRLAGLFSQYMIYRPDWLATWERGGKVPEVDDNNPMAFVGEVWRAVFDKVKKSYRTQVQKQLVDKIANGAATAGDGQDAAAIVHVFGMNHMSVGDIELLQAIAKHRVVVMYVPDPSVERWKGVQDSDRAALKLKGDEELSEHERQMLELSLLDAPQPLVSKWARLGQHFFAKLEGVNAMLDTRHHLDKAEYEIDPAMEIETRLQNLQESIRRYDAELLQREFENDRSLLVHSCHTPLRELEVLRNSLLLAMTEDGTLKPDEILVVAPQIGNYAALIPAVFGAPGDRTSVLPYTMNDVPLARSHALVEWVQTLLSVPSERMTAAKVLQLLRNASVLRALKINETQVDDVAEFLATNHVAWGFDAEDRASHGVPARAENTLAWGFDRLMTAQVFGASRNFDDGVVFDGVMAAESKYRSGATDFEWAGALDTLLVKLFGFNQFARAKHKVPEWLDELGALFDALISVDGKDEKAVEVWREINTALNTLREEVGNKSPSLNYAAMHDLMIAKLERLDSGEFVGGGGVTFAGMVPQRAIPFRMIAVLGLNAGEFPRNVKEDGLDLMLRFQRVGDREVRMDDRYLFLETIMSARDRLHLSYVGESASDGKERNPALPLQELMNELPKNADGKNGAWFVKHPLQPFDSKYFTAERTGELVSFDAPPAKVESAIKLKRAKIEDAIAAVASAESVTLKDVIAYYRDPAKYIASQRHDQFEVVDVEDYGALQEEPLDPGFDRRLRMNWQLFLHALMEGEASLNPEEAPNWLRANGMTATGDLMEMTWENAAEEALEAYRSREIPSLTNEVVRTVIDLQVDGVHLQGYVDAYEDTQGGLHILVPAFKADESVEELSMKELLPAFVQWAALRLQTPDKNQAVNLHTISKAGNSDWARALNQYENDDPRELVARLGKAVKFFLASDRLYFPKTSWAAALNEEKIQSAWAGTERTKGEIQYSHHTQLLFGDLDFGRQSADRSALLADARFLFDVLNVDESLRAEDAQ